MTRHDLTEHEDIPMLDAGFDRTISALAAARDSLRQPMLEAVALMTGTFVLERTVLAAGNGGSATQAQHLAAELVGRFKVPGRPALPVIPLCADTATLTAWSNDVGFEDVFARGVEAFGHPGDLLVGISTSGRSMNLVRAFDVARARGVRTLALLGGDGGDLLPLADVALVVPSRDTQSIQDVHSTLVHVLCELVERRLAESGWFPLAALGAAGFRPVGRGMPGAVRASGSTRTVSTGKPDTDGKNGGSGTEAGPWPTR